MPTVTCNVAKGIPPRQRSPAGAAKGKTRKLVRKAHKRKAPESDADSGQSSEGKPRAKKRHRRRQEASSEQELEVVDSAPEAGIEEVEDENTGAGTSDDSQVNTTLILKQKTLTLSIGA